MFLKVLVLVQLIRTCASLFCDRSFTASSSSISTPGKSTLYYDPGMDCTYSITVKSDNYIKLTWSYFNIRGKMPNCYDDYVEISTGCSYHKRRISRFCSTNMAGLPHTIYSKDNCMEVRFHSSSSGSRYNGGFRAYYQSYDNNRRQFTSCSSSGTKTSTSGVIGSPGWPTKIDKSGFPFWGECKTTIKQYNTKKLIKLNFMDMDVSSSYSCSSWSSTYVKYEGEKSLLTSREENNYYCQKTSPFSLETQYYEVDIKMKVGSSSFINGRGFVVGWVAYEDDEAVKASKYGWIAGLVIALIVLAIVVFLVYRRYKKRNSTSYVRTVVPPPNTMTTTTNVTTDGPGSYPKQQYPPPQPQQPMYPTQYATQGYPDQAPPPYPGPPVGAPAYPDATAQYPPQQQPAYAPQQPAYPPQQPAYPPQQPAYPPQQPAYPPMQPQTAPYPPPGGYGATPQ